MSFITDLSAKVIAGVAIACTAGGGAVVLDAQRDNAVQDTEIEGLKKSQETIVEALREQTKEVSESNKKLERLIGQMEGRNGR